MRGPILRRVRRQTATHRIDSECEKLVEFCVVQRQVERRRTTDSSQTLPDARDKKSCGAAPQSAVRKKIRRQKLEKLVGARARLLQTRKKPRVKGRRCLEGSHKSPRRKGFFLPPARYFTQAILIAPDWMREVPERYQKDGLVRMSCILRKALPRWLRRFFSSGEISAEVRPSSGNRNTGSYPKPCPRAAHRRSFLRRNPKRRRPRALPARAQSRKRIARGDPLLPYLPSRAASFRTQSASVPAGPA